MFTEEASTRSHAKHFIYFTSFKTLNYLIKQNYYFLHVRDKKIQAYTN